MHLNEMVDAARREDWTLVDAHIKEFGSPHDFQWAFRFGLSDRDQNIRDLAASILDETPVPFQGEEDILRRAMIDDPHHIVRFRLAIALYERGDRDTEVVKMWEAACNDPDVGERARAGRST